jgi:anti-anti-sigma factor
VGVPAVSTRTFAHTIVIVVSGDLDEDGSHRLRRVLVDAIMRRRPRRVIVDLARATDLVDSAVGALIAAHDSAPDLHVTFALRRPNADVAATLAGHGLT